MSTTHVIIAMYAGMSAVLVGSMFYLGYLAGRASAFAEIVHRNRKGTA